MTRSLIAFLTSFVFSLILMPVLINLLKKKQAGQTILGYVENHKEKNGTTTMGGIIFMLSTLVVAFIFLDFNTEWFMVVLFSLFFGILGFLDDFLKIRFKQNLGLRPYQKIIGQFGLSIIFAIYIYFSTNGGNVFLPWTNQSINLGIWVIPLVVLVLIATTNSVNLTDGLDGLAGSVTFVYLIFFVVINLILRNNLYTLGEVGQVIDNFDNINILSFIVCGSILAFLLFNSNKASIFMGDVGSLFLGGFVGASACLIGQELLIPILGFCFVFSAVSVIMQVASFKLTKKRIFKMAPFHHHLQMSGLSETKVVTIYVVTTIIIGLFCLIFYLI